MPKSRPPLYAGVPPTDHRVGARRALAKPACQEFEPTAQSIRNWVAQAARDAGRRGDALSSNERDELSRLRRENRQLRQERDILSKAAAWFARETNTIPPKDSGS